MGKRERLTRARNPDKVSGWLSGKIPFEERAEFFAWEENELPKLRAKMGIPSSTESAEAPDERSPSDNPRPSAATRREWLLNWLAATEPPPDLSDRKFGSNAFGILVPEIARISKRLEELLQTPEPPKGDAVLTRNGYIRIFQIEIERCRTILLNAIQDMTEDGADRADLDWLRMTLSMALQSAFIAGMHAHAADTTILQADAARGKKVLTAAEQGGAIVKAAAAGRTQQILAEMKKLILDKHSVMNAARIVSERRQDVTATAARAAWYRRPK